MQSLGENTIAALFDADSFQLGETNNKKVEKTANDQSKNIPTTTNLKHYTEDSDIGKYFKDSIGSFVESVTNSSKNHLNNYKPPLDIVILSNKSKSPEAKENEEAKKKDDLDASLDLTQRSQIYTRSRTKKKFIEQNSKPNDAPLKKKPRKNTKPLEQIQLAVNSNDVLSLKKSSPVKNHEFLDVQDNTEKKIDSSKCPKTSLDNELSPRCGKSSLANSVIEISSIINTQDQMKLAHWGLPLTILRKYESRGVTCMFPWQVECLRNPEIVEKYKNLVYSAPTSAGKTLVSEILVIKNVIERRKKVIFVLPFVSVVREKMYYFKDLLIDSGVRVEGFMGGIHPPGGFANTDVAIATIEKANSLINQLMEEDELKNVGAVVIDELHLLGDSHRGYLLELLLTKLKYMNLKQEHIQVQLIGMSATLPNLNLLANWLDAELYKTDFRPVPLQELCKIGSTIYDNKLNSLRDINPLSQLPTDPDNVLQLCFETIRDGHSVLIFCPTKNWCENLAQQISKAFFQLGHENTTFGQTLRNQLNTEAIMETLEQLKRTPVGLDKVLRSTVSFGVAFHHAGLTIDERDVIEGAFRLGALRVLTATSTLSSGVNLPARRVIVRTPIFHGKPIDTLTYKQMIGRAGRMGKDTAGESILVCKPCEKSTASNILNSSLQPIESCLEGSSLLIRALLEVIASEVAYTQEDIVAYMKCTLLSFTTPINEVELSTKEAVDFLIKNELLLAQTAENGILRWVATPLGKACLAASVPPKDGLFLFEELQKARQCFVLDTELHVIYLVTPFNSGSQIGQIDWYVFLDLWRDISDSERRVGQLVGVKESYIMSALRGGPKPGKILDIHKRFYTALALHDLVREIPLNKVCNKYNCCRGVIQSLQQTASTFAGMVTQFCKKLGWNCIELLVSQFQARLQFGVCRELLDLLRLPMLNGLRARSLYKEGITNVAELAMANELDVERALHKALPFESEKKKFDEDEDETERRNRMRTVFVTGKDGLTPRMASMMLVNEARILVQNELGLDELLWNKKDRSKHEPQIQVSSSLSIKPSAISRVSNIESSTLHSALISVLSNSNKNNMDISNRIMKSVDEEKSPALSINLYNVNDEIEREQEIEKKVKTGETDYEKRIEKIKEIIEPIYEEKEKTVEINHEKNNEKTVEVEMNMLITENLKCNENKKIKEVIHEVKPADEVFYKLQDPEQCGISPIPPLIRNSRTKRSYSQSPNLFDDSLVVDTQECNILEQNIVDIDSELFNDTIFSEPNSPVILDADKSKNIKKINSVERNKSGQLISTSKSIVWKEDTWNNTTAISDNTKTLQTTPTTTGLLKNIQRRSKDLDTPPSKSRLSKFEVMAKQDYNTSGIVKSPIANIVKFVATRRLSTGSNKSEDDVIIDSQVVDKFPSAKKTRTRMKLESLRSRTQKITDRTQIQSANCQEKKVIDVDPKSPVILVIKNPTLNDNKDNKLNSAILRDDCGSSTVVCNSDEEIQPKKLNNASETKKTSKKLRELDGNSKKLESRKKALPKDLSIVNISLNQIKFNEFKLKISGKKEFALALACEIFPTNPEGIGTRIVSGGSKSYHIKKKPIKIGNSVYNDKKLCGVAIFWGRTVYYLSFENVQGSTRVPVKERIELLIKILSTPELKVRCFAAKEIYKTLYKCCKLSPCCIFLDPLTADWLLNPENSEKTFGNLITEHLPKGSILLERLKVLDDNIGPGMNVNSSVSAEIRACTEAVLTWHLLQSLSTKLETLDPILPKTFRRVEMATVSIVSRMELTGMGVNLTALQELTEVINQQLSILENKAFALAGKKFNFSSSKSVAQVLGMDKGKKICTNKAALEHYDHPIANIVMNWRKLNAAHTKMVCPLLSLAERNSRIYSNCITNTVTGRITMYEPNLQNVPRDFNSADNNFIISVRMAFVPSLGNALVSADYCQLELRILAHFSKEPTLTSVLKKPGDVFKNIAARWHNTLESKIDDTMRQRTKQLCYGMIYGMGIKTLAETLQVNETEAREFLETFMGTYPGIKKWLSETIDQARERGFITTLMKRRRMLPAINSEIGGEKGQAERQAINSTIQGSAADITKMAMICIDEKLRQEYPNMPMVLPDMPVKRKLRRSSESLPRGGYLVLHLHDELVYEVNALDLNRVVRIIKEGMENAYSLDVPLPVKVKTGPAWGDLTEYIYDTSN
ncbi:hypothetical protein PV326_008551 [Microctonus aethiopoides]|nr:hypothetical protein PV326_008551 [Microctonus aethiopoides]